MNAADPARDESRPPHQEPSAAHPGAPVPSRPRDPAVAAAAELVEQAGVADLAAAAADHAAGEFEGNVFTAVMAHQAALSHRLAMRFGAMADHYLDATSPSVDRKSVV